MRCRTVACVMVVAIFASARVAFAQTGLSRPLVDIGFDASVAGQPGQAARVLSSRLTLNPALDTAVTFRADALVTSRGATEVRSRRFVVELHRTFVHRGRWSFVGIAGGGVHRGEFTLPAGGPRTGVQGTADPSRVVTRLDPAWTLGVGLTQQVGTRLLLRQDVRLAIHDDGPDMVVSAGLAVPLGRYAMPREQHARLGGGSLRTGQRVWLTGDDGAVTTGIVGAVSARAVEVLQRTSRTTVDLAGIAKIEVPDSVADGARNGALIGAASMGAIGALVSGSLCECNDGTAFLFALATAGYGAGGGALAGALADSFHVGRRTILDRTPRARLAVGPMLGTRLAGASGIVSW